MNSLKLPTGTAARGWREDHGVDDVDDSVTADQTGGDNLAVDLRHLARLDLGGHEFGRNAVAGENRDELGLVLRQQKRLRRAGGQFGESGVGRRENYERAGAAQGFNEPSGLHVGDKRVVIGRADGNFYDLLGGDRGDQTGAAREGGPKGTIDLPEGVSGIL